MTNALEIEKIEARQAEIREAMDRLDAEYEENEIALRVIKRFAIAEGGAAQGGKDTKTRGGTPRPEGIPTLFEMVEDVIREAAKGSGHGLSGREIVDAIEEKYWPGVVSTQILPSVYRFVKAKRLRKTRAGRFLATDEFSNSQAENEGATAPSEANTGSVGRAPGVLQLQPRLPGQ